MSDVKFVKLSELRIRPGLKYWELDTHTLLIREATITEQRVGKNKKVPAVVVRPNCRYVVALNQINADLKFIKMLGLQDKLKRVKR